MNDKKRLLPLFLLIILGLQLAVAQTATSSQSSAAAATTQQRKIDRDLMEITIPKLEELYRAHQYTVTKVVRWYIERIERYNGIYGAVQTVDVAGALAAAGRLDLEAKAGGMHFMRGPLWGVPVLTKANTSVQGLVTTDGWKGYALAGLELLASRDATIITKMRTAGAVILGQTNMPDFAASDTNRSSLCGRTGNAYDVRFSPGGSSGGTVTALTGNFALLGTGTDTGNSIRMPSATSAVVGVFPTRGLVSTAGIAPLDWLLDNTGPIARTVTDAAIALDVMAGEDALDPRTVGSAAKAQAGPYTKYLKTDALKGKRFGVPAFFFEGSGIPFQGIPAVRTPQEVRQDREDARLPLRPETREAFLKALEGLQAAGATVVMDESILSAGFPEVAARIGTTPYVREGTEKFLAEWGPARYHSIEQYEKAAGTTMPGDIIIGMDTWRKDRSPIIANIETDPQAEANYYAPQKKALEIYDQTLDRMHLDGYVYPATQMPPPDESMPQDGKISEGPHSDTGYVNMLGVPAVVVPGGYYPGGLPFGLEVSTKRWHDGDLIGWAFAYERATHHRKPPVLVEQGLLRKPVQCLAPPNRSQ
jgi:amidase